MAVRFRIAVLLIYLIMSAPASCDLRQMCDTDHLTVTVPISCIISAIRSAISPETPVSISSNTIVGNFTAPAIIALIESITRAISPPEATEDMLCNVPFLLAENRKLTVSSPVCPVLSSIPFPLGSGRWAYPAGPAVQPVVSPLHGRLPHGLFVSTAACFFTRSYWASLRAVSSAMRSS